MQRGGWGIPDRPLHGPPRGWLLRPPYQRTSSRGFHSHTHPVGTAWNITSQQLMHFLRLYIFPSVLSYLQILCLFFKVGVEFCGHVCPAMYPSLSFLLPQGFGFEMGEHQAEANGKLTHPVVSTTPAQGPARYMVELGRRGDPVPNQQKYIFFSIFDPQHDLRLPSLFL